MKISYNWLKQYLNINMPSETLSELLTDCGLEVEGLEKWQSIQGGLEGLVIGQVKTCEKHPDADKLSITTVEVADVQLLPIVCGAPNVAAGQKVVVATVGTTLYDGDDSFVIKKAKLRGQPSEGMICAEDEIGLGTSHDGIMVLDNNAPIGMPASEYFHIEEDYIFEIGLTPNRTDAMSHIGVARDIKAVIDKQDFVEKKATNVKFSIPPISLFAADNHELGMEVILENPEACPRYTGLTIKNIEVKASPQWLQNRLRAIGLRPINNIVDITNFVLHETGQPLHAFDAAAIKGNKVIVKKLPKDSVLFTLDEMERKLRADDLMICNAEEGMCIGGVFGGLKSGVTENTKAIFLESAYFDSVHIRKTAKHHDLQTDASFRFERGVDPDNTLYALKRAALLIKEIAGGIVSSDIYDLYPNPVEKTRITVSWKNIDRLIGKKLGSDLIKTILASLDFETIEETDAGLVLNVPYYRVDVTREADVIEEILRVYGYNNIEIPEQLLSAVSHAPKPNPEQVRNSISDFLSNRGFAEIMNNSLTKSAYYENRNDFNPNKSVAILNPLSRALNVLRQSLLFGGLETIAYNQNRKNTDLKIYEFGKTYHFNPEKGKENIVTQRYHENSWFGLFMTGRKEKENWNTSSDLLSIFDIKSAVIGLLNRCGADKATLKYQDEKPVFLSQGFRYLYKQKIIACLGSVDQKLLSEFNIKQDVFYAEINWELLLQMIADSKVNFKPLAKFHEVRRDLALLVDKTVTFGDLEKLAFETDKKFLKSVNLFDVYEGNKIEAGKKSYALSFILQDENKTLTDKVIDKTMNKLMRTYQSKLDAVIR